MYLGRMNIRNCRSDKLKVIIEPWADEFVLERDEMIVVECDAEKESPLDVEIDDKAFVVFGSNGSKMRVRRDGLIIWECHQGLPS